MEINYAINDTIYDYRCDQTATIFISYAIKRRKRGLEIMYKTKKTISCFILCAIVFSLCACGKGSKDNAAIYGETIGGSEDDELFAIIDTNAPLSVLLVTSHVYDDGKGKQAAIDCDVYYLADREDKNIGTIKNMGTAYTISYDEIGIYTASDHSMQRFEVEKSRTIKLAKVINEQFNKNGNAAYTMEKENETKTISEEEYYDVFDKYNNATVVSFAYGASDAAG